MSDSGFSQLPPGGRVFDPATVPAKPEQAVKIDSVRGDLREIKRATRVQGEVTAVSRNGTATIRTENGAEIDIKIRGRMVMQQGQKIEIDLPPGTPPRQAVIRPAPEPPAPPQPTVQTQPPSRPLPPVLSTPAAAPLPPASQNPVPLPALQHSLPPSIPAEMRAILDDITPPLAPLPQAAAPRPVPAPLSAPLPQGALMRLMPLPAFPESSALLPPPPFSPATLHPATLPAPLDAAPALMQGLQTHLISELIPGPAAPVIMFNPLPQNAAAPSSPLAILQPLLTRTDPAPATQPLVTTLPAGAVFQLQPLLLPATSQTPPALQFPQPNTTPQRLDVRIGAISLHGTITLVAPGHKPDPAMAATPPLTATPATLQARVIGLTPQHLPVLSIALPGQAEGAPFLLQIPTGTLPIGMQLELLPQAIMPSAIHPASSSPASTAPTLAMDLLSGWTWPVFDDALDVMAAENPARAMAAQSLAQIMPNPANPAQMTPAILFFVAAIRAGDLGGWMGEKTANTLKREGSRGADIMEKLTRDFSGLSKMLSEPLSQDWRGMAIPYLWQNEVQKMNLYFRHQGGEDQETPEDKKDRSTRFIFDLHLDRMGDVQLDGLMKGPRFDLILRTHTPFTHAMQTVMRQKYLDILEAGNLQGDLAFQTRKDQWIRVSMKASGLKTSA